MQNVWQRKDVWFFFFMVLQALDLITTFMGLQAGLNEGNSIAVWLSGHLGTWALYGWKVVGVTLFLGLLAALHQRYPGVWAALRVATVLMMVAVSINLLTLALQVPRLLA